MFLFYREEYDRYYRSGSGAESYYRRKEETYRDPYLDPWNGRREPEGMCAVNFFYHYLIKTIQKTKENVSWKIHLYSCTVDDRARPEERRRNELYRQYYEELQRRHDTDRPVDCSVIVVNKAQKYVRSLLCTLNADEE